MSKCLHRQSHTPRQRWPEKYHRTSMSIPWAKHKRYGTNYNAIQCNTMHPNTLQHITAYTCRPCFCWCSIHAIRQLVTHVQLTPQNSSMCQHTSGLELKQSHYWPKVLALTFMPSSPSSPSWGPRRQRRPSSSLSSPSWPSCWALWGGSSVAGGTTVT